MPAEAVLATLRHLLEAIRPLQLQVALMGGLALAVWKHPRFTRDVDILLSVDPDGEDKLLEELANAGFRARTADPRAHVGEFEFLHLRYEPSDSLVEVQVDILLATSDYQLEALSRCITVQSEDLGFEVNVLACEDLIIHKLLAGRVIDRADTTALLLANRESLDAAYVFHWLEQLALRGDFEQAWQDAFPGESMPQA